MQLENDKNIEGEKMENKSIFQLKCRKCGSVRHVNGPLTENDKICPDCKYVINESWIMEVKQDSFLLE